LWHWDYTVGTSSVVLNHRIQIMIMSLVALPLKQNRSTNLKCFVWLRVSSFFRMSCLLQIKLVFQTTKDKKLMLVGFNVFVCLFACLILLMFWHQDYKDSVCCCYCCGCDLIITFKSEICRAWVCNEMDPRKLRADFWQIH
jgi:hypothetical protein